MGCKRSGWEWGVEGNAAYHAAVVVIGAAAVVVRGPRDEVVGGGVVAAAQLAHARQAVRREGDVVVHAWVGAAKDLVVAGPGRVIRIRCEVACHRRARGGGLQAVWLGVGSEC